MSTSDPDPAPETDDVDKPDAEDPDTESDPALADEEPVDWGSEGGATEAGPATATGADD